MATKKGWITEYIDVTFINLFYEFIEYKFNKHALRQTGMIEIIFEDNHLIAINKRSGVLVQGDKSGDATLSDEIKQYLKVEYNKQGQAFLGVVHRIDRPVSGVILFAKTSKALTRLNEIFRSRSVQKVYWAISDRKPVALEGQLIHWLKKDEKKNKTTSFIRKTVGALRSELRYKLLKSGNGKYFFEVQPLTGRSHQIRAQLAAIGCPILADVKYGGKDINNSNVAIALHARSLEFIHPIKNKKINIEAEPPQAVWWESIADKC